MEGEGMAWRSGLSRAALALALSTVAAVAVAAPPPPGWQERARLAACGPDPQPPVFTSVEAVVSPIPVSTIQPGQGRALHVSWAARLRLPRDSIGRIVGLAYDQKLGLLAMTDRGQWLVFDLARLPGARMTAIQVTRLSGAPGAPVAMSPEIFGQVLGAFNDAGSVAAYDLSWCGLAAIPQPRYALTPGETVSSIGVLQSYLTSQPNLLFVGTKDGRAAGLATSLRTDESALSLGAPVVEAVSGARLVGATGMDASAGCNAVALWRPLRSPDATILQAFCSPEFSPTPVAIHGDVSWRIKRLDTPEPGATLGRAGLPLNAITEVDGSKTTATYVGIAQDKRQDTISLVAFSIPAARYDDHGPQAAPH